MVGLPSFYSPRLTSYNEVLYVSSTQNVNGIFVSELAQDGLQVPLTADMESKIVNNVEVFNNKVYAVGYTFTNYFHKASVCIGLTECRFILIYPSGVSILR